MPLHARQLVFATGTLISIGAIVATYLYTKAGWKPDLPNLPLPVDQGPESCPNHLKWLADLDVTFPVRYVRRDIIVNEEPDAKRESITKLEVPLFLESQVVDPVGDPNVKLEHCAEPLVLDVSPKTPYDAVDASHIIFGMSTELERLEKSMPYIERWLPQSKAQLFVIVVGPDETEPDPKAMKDVQAKLRKAGLNIELFSPLAKDDHMAERYFSLVKLICTHREPSTKWIAIMDDDTFFPSMHNLVSSLNTRDSSQEWYIGAMSEEWWAVVRYGMMAFGGAGVFLSIPLAAVIDANYQDCKDRSGASAGDMRIRECIIWHSDTKLTHLEGLHQIDMHGDVSGVYESGRLPLSLHHWKQGWWDLQGYGTWFPLHKMHFVADVCGGCFLQRWWFDGDVVLANGYSISMYPTGALDGLEKSGQLGRVEDTWEDAGVVEGSNNKGWDHYLGPLRPPLELEREKIQYRFLDAKQEERGVRQWYLHMGVDGELDTLFELLWRKGEARNASGP